MFVRHDWTLFRSLETLAQKAGVAREHLGRLVAKELADNALDVAMLCKVTRTPNGFVVQDDGPGIDGTPDEIASLFSIARPLTSSKLVRTTSRRRLGNGVRVVTGAVLASEGSLKVGTRGRLITLEPNDDGTTSVVDVVPWTGEGTHVLITLGEGLADDDGLLTWANRAVVMSRGGTSYRGRSSAWWYDRDGFYELFQAAENRTVREVIATLDGYAEPKAGKVAADFRGQQASALSREECAQLLDRLRRGRALVQPSRLGGIGREGPTSDGYGRAAEVIKYPGRQGVSAHVPTVVEAWVELTDEEPQYLVHVNRTPITSDTFAAMRKKDVQLIAGGIMLRVPAGRAKPVVWLNVETPHIPLTDDGKEPDLARLEPLIAGAVARAIRGAKRAGRSGLFRPRTVKQVILEALAEAAEKASGGGKIRYSLRQLFYAVRPTVLDAFEKEPDYGYFCQVVTDYEAECGEDMPGMYRDARGTLYHPHSGDTISLSTLAVEKYERPPWTFKHVLYCEKEGLFQALFDAKFPERYDCALLTSKGFASRAARDVIDLLGETQEEIIFFAVHDADGFGTKIFESLQEATKARPGRRVQVINLGLEPAEAREMGLQIERVGREGGHAIPVAAYVPDEDRAWLQAHRAELNAMDSPQFVAWIEEKFREHITGKLVPPRSVLRAELRQGARAAVETRLTEKILRENGLEQRVEEAFASVDAQLRTRRAMSELDSHVRGTLDGEPELSWRAPIEERADELAREAVPTGGGAEQG